MTDSIDNPHQRRVHLPKPKNSAGRNLPVAIATSVVLVALVLVSIYVGPVTVSYTHL